MAKDNANNQSSSTVETNTFVKGMIKDVADIFIPEGVWTNAINAINNTHNGEQGTIGNEPSTSAIVSAPYTIIGILPIVKTKWAIFSTDNIDSEIGIFDEAPDVNAPGTYLELINDRCLNFKKTNLITGAVKENYDGTFSAYWQDALNPDRTMNLDPTRIPYKCTPIPDSCGEQNCTTELDCDLIRLHPYVEQACVRINKSKGSGQLNNGSYQAVIAYSENGVKLTDYSMPSNTQSLFDHTGMGGSLDITVSNLDPNFEEYELVVIAVINQQTIAKKIGYYSITQTNIHLDLFQQSLVTIDLAAIPLKTAIYEKSEKMFDIGGYLIRSSVTSQPFVNYQPFANQIVTKWVAAEYPADYYWSGGNNLGNMRDEVYPYFIRWVYATGARTASYHIPGRAATNADLELVPLSNDNVIDDTKNKMWQVYDTATRTNATGLTEDGGVIVANGLMAYWESTERYPDNTPEVWGDLCGEPIRHHKMPSNETIHIHNNAGDKIYILGVQFDNIKQPKDNKGNYITDIVGYEILRGSREGNRSIVAKGLFNNMVKYNIEGNPVKSGLFQNYPYNDLRSDPFYNGRIDNGIEYKRDIFSFHAPENNLVKPFVGAGGYIKIYTEEKGDVLIRPELPHKHPQFKFMNEYAFTLALAFATGIALLELFGNQSNSTTGTGHTEASTNTGNINPGFINGTGGIVPAPGLVTKLPGVVFDSSTTTTSQGGIGAVAGGFVNNQASLVASGAASGVVGGLMAAATVAATIAGIVYSAIPTFYRAFDQALELIYHYLTFRDHALQLNSHGFYNNYDLVDDVNVPIGKQPSFIRNIKGSSAKYISSGLQDYDANYIVNNLNRNKFLSFSLNKIIKDPATIDTTRNLPPNSNNALVSYSTTTSAYYGAIKYNFDNQYGQLSSIVQLPVNSCVLKTSDYNVVYKSSVIFGGDVYINRYTEKNPYYFFNTWLFDVPNGTEFNYDVYRNGPTPSYYLDSRRYDASLFSIQTSEIDIDSPIPEFSTNNPTDYFNFFGTQNAGQGIRNAYIFLFNNGVRDFFTESELNLAYRDYGEDDVQKFYDPYGDSFSDLHTMFRADLIKTPIYYEYDLSLSASKLYSNFKSWGNVLPRDYNPVLYETAFQYYPRRVIYSLQQQSGLKRDNWRNYLQFNYKDWKGKVNNIKALNAQGALILFEDLEPMQFVGIDTFESAAGVKYTTGDGGLFMQNMQSIINADDAFEYGTSISNRGVVNTPYGLFWISQKTGKICSFGGSGGITEISNSGMKHWFLENLPSELLKKFPDYKLYDNPVDGIGCQAIFDSQYDLLYFTKKDYLPINDCLRYDPVIGFYDNCSPITLTCPLGYTLNTVTNKCEKTVLSPKITPVFGNVYSQYCGTSVPSLPTVSDNGITGTWSFITVDPTHFVYTFTPSSNPCAITITKNIELVSVVTPTFTITKICPGLIAPTLPTTSDNNITGTWFPAPTTNPEQSYTFTPNSGQCATSVELAGTDIYAFVWQEKNLDTAFYRNGDPIPNIEDGELWKTATEGAWCYYNNDPANGAIYGKLYNYYAVCDPRGLAPIGYHVPTYNEWEDYLTCLGGDSISGGKMKEAGTTHWYPLNTGATNSSGFTGLPAGFRLNVFGNSGFFKINEFTAFWSRNVTSNPCNPVVPLGYAYFAGLNNNNTETTFGYNSAVNNYDVADVNTGFSVRCLKD